MKAKGKNQTQGLKLNHRLLLTTEELALLSQVFHVYKDEYRGESDCILPVMNIEKKLQSQTQGVYKPDTTYNLRTEKYRVTLFNMNLGLNKKGFPAETREVEIEAVSQNEAERLAISGGLINLQSGWGVWESRLV